MNPRQAFADPHAAFEAPARSIGRRSRDLRNRHLIGRIWRVIAGVAGVFAASALVAWAGRGLDFPGLLLTALGALVIAALLLRYPGLEVPRRAELARGPAAGLVGRTELWLEARQARLPASAGQIVAHMGILLDGLGEELDRAAEGPATRAGHRLVAEELPEAVCAYLDGRIGETALNEALRLQCQRMVNLTRRLADGG
jgi:hypothetical protein